MCQQGKYFSGATGNTLVQKKADNKRPKSRKYLRKPL